MRMHQGRSIARFVFEQESREKAIFEKIASLKSYALLAFVTDYTYWDDMVRFATGPLDLGWAAENLDASSGTFGADAYWVFSSIGDLVYSNDNLEGALKDTFPLSKEIFPYLFVKSKIPHFFVKSPQGELLEFYAGTIHPTADVERKTPPQGYFFATRVWKDEYVRDLSFLVSGTVSLELTPQERQRLLPNALSFTVPLYGWDERPVAQLSVEIESKPLRQFIGIMQRQFTFILIFGLLIGTVVVILVTYWVSLPLRAITLSLQENDPGLLSSLKTRQNEYGELSRLILDFFSQKEELLRQNEFTAALIDTSPAFFAAITLDGKTKIMNKSMLSALGYTKEEVLGKDYLATFVPPEDREALKEIFRRIVTENKTTANENWLVAKGGRKLLVEWHGVPVHKGRDEQGYFFAIGIDITGRRQAEAEREEKRNKVLLFQEALLTLVRQNYPDMDSALREFLEKDAHTLGVERVSIWLFARQGDCIECKDLFLLSRNAHESGMSLAIKDFPSYFKALEEKRVVLAPDACSDPQTRELSEPYFKPLGISSLMDLPLIVKGKTIGILSHEHVGPARVWTLEEQGFATSIAEMAARELQAEEHRQIEERYRKMIEASNEGIWSMDQNFRITFVNDRMSRLLGYSAQEMLGHDISDFIPAQEIEDHRKKMELRSQGASQVYERAFLRKDGSLLWALVSASPILGKEGRFFGSFAMFTDISERKKAEDMVKESKDYFYAIINTINDPVFVKDEGSHFKLVNDAFCKFIGRAREEIVGKNDADFFPAEQVAVFLEKDRYILQTGEDNINEEFLTDAEGRTSTIVTKKSLYTEAKGNRFIVGIIRDITDRKKAEEELRQAYARLQEAQMQLLQSEKMAAIGQLASGVGHEINNPLTGVLNNVQLIRMMAAQKLGQADCKDIVELLAVVEESALRCKKITQTLLDFSHAAKGEMQEVDINLTAEKVVALTQHELSLGNIQIRKDLAPDLPFIMGDPQLLQQIIFNLITNAKWAIDKKGEGAGGEIRLHSYLRKNNTVCLDIADTGIGISPEHLPKVFDPFFTTKPVGEGTGLGLSIAFHIIKQHKGGIEVKSEPGKGAVFTLCLPGLLQERA